ncbi:MAG: DUF3828 domain-containing protein [Novosphingobium sp.]
MILAALALAAAPTPAATPEAAIAAIYAPFNQADMRDAAWERPIFTSRLRALIAKWRAVTPSDEVDDLSDFDWLCQCQDWDSPTFRTRIIHNRSNGPGRRAVTVALGSPHHRHAPVRFVLQRMGSAWLIDDIFASGFRGGLRASLVRTTAADIALRQQR